MLIIFLFMLFKFSYKIIIQSKSNDNFFYFSIPVPFVLWFYALLPGMVLNSRGEREHSSILLVLWEFSIFYGVDCWFRQISYIMMKKMVFATQHFKILTISDKKTF